MYREGIAITDNNGTVLGKSKNAGLIALSLVALSRCILPIPALFAPPLIISRLEKTSFIKAHPRLVFPLNLGVIVAMLYTGLPTSIALFPQRYEISPQKLEPEFHHLKTNVFFNKGL